MIWGGDARSSTAVVPRKCRRSPEQRFKNQKQKHEMQQTAPAEMLGPAINGSIRLACLSARLFVVFCPFHLMLTSYLPVSSQVGCTCIWSWPPMRWLGEDQYLAGQMLYLQRTSHSQMAERGEYRCLSDAFYSSTGREPPLAEHGRTRAKSTYITYRRGDSQALVLLTISRID